MITKQLQELAHILDGLLLTTLGVVEGIIGHHAHNANRHASQFNTLRLVDLCFLCRMQKYLHEYISQLLNDVVVLVDQVHDATLHKHQTLRIHLDVAQQ